jgi:hypothetical protein
MKVKEDERGERGFLWILITGEKSLSAGWRAWWMSCQKVFDVNLT